MSKSFFYDVFLSHSAKEKAVVRDVAERLRKDGLKVWFDEWVLKPGDSIPANAFSLDWAQLESGTFQVQGHHALRDPLNKEHRFLPLRVDDASGLVHHFLGPLK